MTAVSPIVAAEATASPVGEVAVVILAKDEAATITHCLTQVVRQSLLQEIDGTCRIIVVANGCSDATAATASAFLEHQKLPAHISYQVVDRPEPGKSRAWNLAVHTLVGEGTDFVFFVDSDIDLRDDFVFEAMFAGLSERPDKTAFVGLPVKHSERLERRSLMDRAVKLVSKDVRPLETINGSLYLARADALREIWLPDETPGEDGFLNAMIQTRGFTSPNWESLLAQSAVATHYFEDVGPLGFFTHERRMVVGTVINNWLCEYLWSLQLTAHAGDRIASLNATQPDWVQDVIDRHTGNRSWVVPGAVVLGRFGDRRGLGFARWARRFPFALAATILSLPSIVAANRLLRQRGAARHW